MKKPINVKSWYPWALVGALWIVAFLNYLDRILLTTMRDPIVGEFSLTDAQFGLLTSVFLWSYGIFSPFGGFLADKYSRRNVIIFSVGVWSLATVWTGYVSSFEEMIAARIVMGVSEAFYIPAGLALITDYHRGKTRSLATGLHFSGLYTGLALGGVGGYIAELWGWRYGFHVFGIFGCVYALLLLFFLRDRNEGAVAIDKNRPESSVKLAESIRSLLNERSYLVLLGYFVVLGIANWLIYAWLPTFLKDRFALGLGEAGISATLYPQIGSFIGVLLGGIWADRWSKANPRGRILVIVLGFTLGAPALIWMSWTSVFVIAILVLLLFGIARGFSDANLMPVVRQVVDSRYAATAYGILNFLSTIAGGLMVYVGGALKDAEIKLSAIYIVAAGLLLVGTWSLLLVKVKKESQE
ncbi:MFS transporter [Parapedobacter indicus]|uniref:Predicted arabinose efflux permease, MFS family n=1 Tax=Parapedobacter indicus TaxID=1477437 RepID=A0A1I3DA38_9SPHI|nr:MFS transporter [Parapedobacter indicus]PPL04586.1 putative MFS family arabinose efflux permease [Parapedobacter indicus]SFH83516.1 Predicted arabinose efflux permease, MFS family [Parapedobacter indicus]